MEVFFVDPEEERASRGIDLEAWLEVRRRLARDRHDEVWDGVYHVVPGPTAWHQLVEARLSRALWTVVESLGLEVLTDLDVIDPARGDKNYRQPDVAVVAPEHLVRRGINGRAELVIEILSPHDESREKFPFYAARAIPECWIIDPDTREAEVYVLRAGAYERVVADPSGAILAPRFGLELRTIDGPTLRVTWPTGSADI